MKTLKKQQLEAAGWKVGTAAEFLELSPEEVEWLELKLALAQDLKQRRENHRLTQTQLAHQIHSSQSRVAKMEAGDPSVSMDLLVRALMNLGATRHDLARIITPSDAKRAA